MFCPKCGNKLDENSSDIPGGSAIAYEAVCQRCGIAYQVVVDDQLPEYVAVYGEPWEDQDE